MKLQNREMWWAFDFSIFLQFECYNTQHPIEWIKQCNFQIQYDSWNVHNFFSILLHFHLLLFQYSMLWDSRYVHLNSQIYEHMFVAKQLLWQPACNFLISMTHIHVHTCLYFQQIFLFVSFWIVWKMCEMFIICCDIVQSRLSNYIN